MFRAKEQLAELMEQQLELIEQMLTIVSAQKEAVARDSLDEAESLDAQLGQVYDAFSQLQKLVEKAESELVTACQEMSRDELAAAIPEILEMRNERQQMLGEHLKQQEGYNQDLAKYVEALIQEGRQMGRTMEAFHGYRQASQPDRRFLDIKK